MKLLIIIFLISITTFAQNTTYKDGTDCHCDSLQASYWESGALIAEVPYVNGQSHGTVKWYYESGSIRGEFPVVNGQSHGTTKFYYKSGALMHEAPYVNGQRHGTEKWYFENGKIAGTATYERGELIGYKRCSNGKVGNEKLICITQ